MTIDDTDEQFIGYCEMHCLSERALFSGSQINRILGLAGYPVNYVRAVPDGIWASMHEEMEELCTIARRRLKETAIKPKMLPMFEGMNNVIDLTKYRQARS